MFALIEAARRREVLIITSSGCVAQAWRKGGPKQANLARVLAGVIEAPLDTSVSRKVGILCAQARTSDVVDAHVSLLASEGDVLVTSDPEDLRTLVRARRTSVEIVQC